jgi:hypothetical protein
MHPRRSGRHPLDTVGRLARQAPIANRPATRQLLQELWLISHFGWIAEAAIRRTLVISGEEILAVSLAERLRQLLNRGWVEQRYSDAGTEELDWRLTDSGRDALRNPPKG